MTKVRMYIYAPHSSMTPCHTNKKANGKVNRYYYYRCTSTFKKDWNECGTRQVSADRLEKYVFENLERIALDSNYVDSLIFKLNFSKMGGHSGLEPSGVCSKLDPETVQLALQKMTKEISESRGAEKNLVAQKFIKDIIYSKDRIQINLFYSRDLREFPNSISPPEPPQKRIKKSDEKVVFSSPENFRKLVCRDKIGSASWTTLEPYSEGKVKGFIYQT